MATNTNTKTKKTETKLDLPDNPFLHEVLGLVSKQRTIAKKVEVLKKYGHESVKSVLIWNFDETVISNLPEGDVPYGDVKDDISHTGSFSDDIKNKAGASENASAMNQDLDGRGRSSLRREWVNLYHYIRGGNDALTRTRREMMFIGLLEKLHPKEAEILVLVKDKLLETKYKLNKSVVQQAYPDITWGNRS